MRPVAMLATVILLTWIGTLWAQQTPDKPFADLTIEYHQESHSGRGLRQNSSGITIVTVPSDDENHTTLILSIATTPNGLGFFDLAVSGQSTSNEPIEPTVSGASGTGREHRVITYVCKFPVPQSELKQITLRQKISTNQ